MAETVRDLMAISPLSPSQHVSMCQQKQMTAEIEHFSTFIAIRSEHVTKFGQLNVNMWQLLKIPMHNGLLSSIF